MEISTKTKNTISTVSALIILAIFIVAFFMLVIWTSNILFPTYETLTIEVELQERTIYNDYGNRDYLLECTFNNGSEILLVLNYKAVDSRADYFSLIAADPGDTFSLLIEIRNDVYYILSIS